MSETLFPLSHIVFPDGDFMEAGELFYRFDQASVRFADGEIKDCRRISFDTWMNLFAAGKWHQYCELGKLYLRLEVQGNFRLQVTGHEFTAAFGVVDRVLLSQCHEAKEINEFLIEIPAAEEYAGVSFSLDFPKGEKYALGEMSWCTDAPPQRQCRIAIDTCTFKREKYVQKTIRKFTEFMEEEEGRGEKFHLFVVDNGRTLEKSLENEYVNIIPNKNAGGAGGFCRGLMEANDGDFTHCLFMDDDVEIYPESFFRTLAITEYFKDEYKTCSVNGPMMNLYDKMEFFENLAAYDGVMGIKNCRGPLDMKKVEDVLMGIDLPPELFHDNYVHSAWWYTCSSLERYKDEYPVPVFFRWDDVEWSWRKQGMEIVSMNGICLWHAPFKWRVGNFAECYYGPRNILFACMIHQQGNEKEMLEWLQAQFDYRLETLNYVGAEVLLMAMTDFLKGHSIFEEDPEKQMQRVRAACGKAKVRKGVDYKALELAGRHALQADSSETGISLDWYPPVNEFQGKKKVEVYNLSAGTCETRLRDDRRAERLAKEFGNVLQVLSVRFEDLRRDMKAGYEKFCTREFWDNYLGTKEAENANG